MRPILRSRTEGVSPVVAEILLVAITVVLAAVIYLMASGMLGSHATPAPVVALAGPNPYAGGGYNATFVVADASRALTMVNYKFNLEVGLSFGNATAFGSSGVPVPIRVNGTLYRVTWTDVDGGGTLTQGDEITVAGNGVSLPVRTNFDFVLVFQDGSQVTQLTWTSP
jgi:flagellin-like protein